MSRIMPDFICPVAVYFVYTDVDLYKHYPNPSIIQYFMSTWHVKIGWLGIVGVDK